MAKGEGKGLEVETSKDAGSQIGFLAKETLGLINEAGDLRLYDFILCAVMEKILSLSYAVGYED